MCPNKKDEDVGNWIASYIDLETEKNLTGIKTNVIIDKIFNLFSSEAAMSNVYQKTEINSKEEIWIIL